MDRAAAEGMPIAMGDALDAIAALPSVVVAAVGASAASPAAVAGPAAASWAAGTTNFGAPPEQVGDL